MEAKLVAFSSRTGLRFNDYNLLLDALTHTSFAQKSETTGRHQLLGMDGRNRANGFVGKKVLELYVSQFVLAKFPSLPPQVCESIVQAYIGQTSLSSVGKSFGVQFVMRWKLTDKASSEQAPLGPPAVSSWVVESLVGALFADQGAEVTKKFIQEKILSRSVSADMHYDAYVKMNKPRQLLSYLMKSLGQTPPVARLLKETGRHSHSPVFIVGMYSGFQKIGEGYGSSLKMAENRAIRDALIKHYVAEIQKVSVPLDFTPEEDISFLAPENSSASSSHH
ncbi:hypothetical protein HDV03_004171 [Kappamyces sp. JEL0829]|nr:hypothetical protein HDV03_004171 [Kappamyces sp. JEL0829]